ncbi:MAG: hypothetical protein ABEI06_02850 [Halobacteriaceae archaeon]
MNNKSDIQSNYASLFEKITGKSTVVEEQNEHAKVGFDISCEEKSIASYIHSNVTEQTFDDVIDEPEETK